MLKGDDRFKGIATDYATLWNEVVREAGFDYQAFQRSIFEIAALTIQNLKECRILDLGIGDGETAQFFVAHGCQNITGIDLNPEMLKASAERFNGAVRLMQCDISELGGTFSPKEFDLVVSGATIHNIPKNDRVEVWNQIQVLNPTLFVSGDKIAEDDPIKHREYFERETKAIVSVYRDKHGLTEMANEWIAHYDVDEQERLYLAEMQQGLAPNYATELVGEFGMYKTVKAIRR
jgi:SAM-dependent methyltransferase